MKVNMGKADRIIRSILGIAVIGAGVAFQSWWGLLGIILLFTGITGWCPLYVPFGINTIPKEAREKHA